METVIYWDSSAVLSALGRESHTDDALSWLSQDGVHLISTLTVAETSSVLHRMRRAQAIDDETLSDSLEVIANLPWRLFRLSPAWDDIAEAASRSGLKGADLWHLSLALTLRKRQFPSVRVLTYDVKLLEAAAEEGLVR